MELDARSPIRHLVRREPVAVDERVTLRSLCAALARDAVGAALVVRADGAPGIVTERDVVRALADGADPDEVWSVDVMTEDLVTVLPDERVVDAALRLVAEDLRHLVVAGDDGVVGVVSSRDVFRVVTDDLLDRWG